MMAFDDSNHVQRMDIFQNKDQLTISLSNVPMAQVGKSVRIDEGRLGQPDNSIPNDASTMIKLEFFGGFVDFIPNFRIKKQRKTDDTSSEAGLTSMEFLCK